MACATGGAGSTVASHTFHAWRRYLEELAGLFRGLRAELGPAPRERTSSTLGFRDGNGRAARLALDHVLSSAGYALHEAAPLFVLARAADDDYGVFAFTSALQLLSGPRA